MAVEDVNAATEKDLEEEASSNEEFEDEGEGLFYVPKKAFEKVSEALENKQEITKEMVTKLLDFEDIADDDMMWPIDVSDMSEFQDGEKMIEELGTNSAAEVFVKARKKFVDMLETVEKDARDCMPKEITFAEYKECMEEVEGMEDCESEEEGEGDDDEDDDEEASEGEDDGAEPSAKKQKTT